LAFVKAAGRKSASISTSEECMSSADRANASPAAEASPNIRRQTAMSNHAKPLCERAVGSTAAGRLPDEDQVRMMPS
jgi:hypothetical protein